MKIKFIEFYMRIAEETALLSSAIRLKVGGIAVKDDKIISIGYNGTPSGWDNNCEYMLDGKLKTKDEVIHSEINILMKIARSNESSLNCILFLTHSPCIECAKAIYQSGIGKIIYKEDFRSMDGVNFLQKCGIPITKYNKEIERGKNGIKRRKSNKK
ncbi:MAG: deaminase [Candidatus Levybacteria bacterium]|nr:deaminase [Candidatus Levybacteria bacterium]